MVDDFGFGIELNLSGDFISCFRFVLRCVSFGFGFIFGILLTDGVFRRKEFRMKREEELFRVYVRIEVRD